MKRESDEGDGGEADHLVISDWRFEHRLDHRVIGSSVHRASAHCFIFPAGPMLHMTADSVTRRSNDEIDAPISN
jgi:hypothetical protein